jgi:PEGA domain
VLSETIDMTFNKPIRTLAFVIAGIGATAAPSFADHGHSNRGRSSGRAVATRHAVVVGRAAPRYFAPRVVRPAIVNVVPYRPYYYTYRPGLSLSFAYGSPYYGYGYGPYGYAPYGYVAPPPAYLSAVPGRPYGGVRIQDAPRDAEVFADGYYMGIVDDFDGVFQHMNLEAGPHRIEIRANGFEPIAFDVRVVPGETISYRADMQPSEP